MSEQKRYVTASSDRRTVLDRANDWEHILYVPCDEDRFGYGKHATKADTKRSLGEADELTEKLADMLNEYPSIVQENRSLREEAASLKAQLSDFSQLMGSANIDILVQHVFEGRFLPDPPTVQLVKIYTSVFEAPQIIMTEKLSDGIIDKYVELWMECIRVNDEYGDDYSLLVNDTSSALDMIADWIYEIEDMDNTDIVEKTGYYYIIRQVYPPN